MSDPTSLQSFVMAVSFQRAALSLETTDYNLTLRELSGKEVYPKLGVQTRRETSHSFSFAESVYVLLYLFVNDTTYGTSC